MNLSSVWWVHTWTNLSVKIQKPAVKETQVLRHVLQEQEAQTLFPTDHRAPLFPSCCFFCLLNIASSSWGMSLLQKYQAYPRSCWLKCHSLSCSEQPSPTPRAWSSRQVHPNKAEICAWAGHLWLPCESMESQSILLVESTVIHLFLKEMVKTEQMNGIINPLIFPCCLESPARQLSLRSLLCKYLKWVESNPTTALTTFPCPGALRHLVVQLSLYPAAHRDLQLDCGMPQQRGSPKLR